MNYMQSYPFGVDCTWLAYDEFGAVATFFTGGSGPIPQSLLEFPLNIQKAERQIWELPVRTEGRVLIDVPIAHDYVEMARRGFYVYDWTDCVRTLTSEIHAYELAAVPLVPLKWSDLLPSSQQHSAPLRPDVHISEAPKLIYPSKSFIDPIGCET